ncbi:MAG: 1-deoxy-D-xylulose-5-phosphate synthase [Planctomycetes bacterium]|nr:1-deoxy-D-xylulose-5-phosphate synthase [Planctomycetota bacterium]
MLEKINSPDDLKTLSVAELEELAEEIRQFMLVSVGKTGGHLASSLGVLELTLALHSVFDFKKDKLLWDVGHQCYVHKILTGRKELFAKLRQRGGVSGFPNPDESDYDQFAVGHAGTSIATAIGMALGEELRIENPSAGLRTGVELRNKDNQPNTQYTSRNTNKIVAIVGDASIVNGVSFEALNNLGLVKRQLLIVLNDNSMAIDQTVGALAKYFSKIRLSQTYEDMRNTCNNILEHLPVIGKGVEGIIERIKKTIRMTLPASQMFESLNIPYFGPVDGHDIDSLKQLFEEIGQLNRPAILHVYTKKGKGFSPAEQDGRRFHSTGPFEINGDSVKSDAVKTQKSFTEVFGDHLVELAEKNEKIVAISSAMCDGTGLEKFREKFPKRFFDVGIAESAAVDIAAGMAKVGLKPVVCIYSTFLQRSFDQLFQEVSLQNLPVVFCIDRAGLVGSDGPTHHGMMDIGFLRMLPNVTLIAPASEKEMQLALEFAFEQNSCVCIRYPKDSVPNGDFDKNSGLLKPFEMGKSVTVKSSPDSKVAVVSYGCMLAEAMKAAEILEKENIQIDVINARFAAPIDEKIIELLAAGKHIITVEDHRISAGFGSAVLEAAAEKMEFGRKTGKITVLAAPKRFIKHDLRKAQLDTIGVNADKIVETVKSMKV